VQDEWFFVKLHDSGNLNGGLLSGLRPR
jgi:hypothetical protein